MEKIREELSINCKEIKRNRERSMTDNRELEGWTNLVTQHYLPGLSFQG